MTARDLDPDDPFRGGHEAVPTDRPSVGSAAADLEAVLATGYLRYQSAMLGSAMVRTLVFRDEIRAPARNAVALGISSANVAHLAGCLDGHTTTDETVAWVDCLTAAAANAIGLRALTPSIWQRGAAWPASTANWSSAGTGVLGRPGPSKAARFALLVASNLVPRRSRATLEGIVGNILVDLGGFALFAWAVSKRLRSVAAGLDERAAALMEEESSLAAAREMAGIRVDVLAEAAVRLVEVRDLLPVDRPAAERLARDEHRLLRGFLAEGDVHTTRPGSPYEADGGRDDASDVRSLGAVVQLDAYMRWLESLYRVTVAVATVVAILRERDARYPRLARLLGAATVVHAGWGVGRLRAPGDDPARALADADVVMGALLAVYESLESRRGRRPTWSLGFSIGLAGAVGGVRSAGAARSAGLRRLLALRVVTNLASSGTMGRRSLMALDETTFMAAAANTAHWFARIASTQARLSAETAGRLIAARAGAEAEQVRRPYQSFVHNSAVQSLGMVGDRRLTVEQLIAWIDRDLPRLAAAAAGEAPVWLSSLTDGIEDLCDGLGLVGMSPRVRVEADPGELPAEVVTSVLTVLDEALVNVYKHSDDRCPVVRVEGAGRGLRLSVDNQRTCGSPGPAGTGTASMRDAASAIGAELVSAASGSRFSVTLTVPARLAG